MVPQISCASGKRAQDILTSLLEKQKRAPLKADAIMEVEAERQGSKGILSAV